MYEQLGAMESSWCSTSNRQTGCSPLSGVCKPMTYESWDLFKALQNQLNRIAAAMKWTIIRVDGRIGSDTVSLYNKAMGTSIASCDQLSSHVLTAGISNVATKANSMGAPTSVPAPITSRPSVINPKTGLPEDPPLLSITDSLFGLVSSPFGLLIAAGLAFGAYKLAKGGKSTPAAKGGRKRRRSARPARARRVRRPRRRVRRARRIRRSRRR